MKKNKKLLYYIIILLFAIGIIFFFLYQKGIIFPKVILSDNNLSLYVGDNAILSYETNNHNKKGTWHSLDPEIVTISDTGLIKANKMGKTQVYLEFGNTKRYCDITVNEIVVSSLKLNKNNIEMSVDEVYQLEYTLLPENATNKTIIWESSNPSVATVENGQVKAINLGESVITIKSSNGIIDNCNVLVNNINVKELIVNQKDINLNKGSVYKLNVNVIPPNASNSTLTYITSNPNSVEVTSDGIIKANQSGSSTITISSLNGITTTCNITVSDTEIIKFNHSTAPNNGRSISINVNDNDYSELVVNTYLNGTIQDNKSIRQKIGNYTVEANGIGKWEIEAYLVYNGIESKKYKYNYGIATTSTIKNNLDTTLNAINFDAGNNILLFGSDYQGGEAKTNVRNILSTINSKNIKVGLFGFLGDYSTSVGDTSSSSSGLSNLNSHIRSFNNFQNTGTIYIQGNHDPENTKHLSKLGAYEADNYAVFLINEDDYPRSASNGNRAKQTAAKLDEYLNSLVRYEVHKPVFVLTHVPLHHSRRADNSYASYILNVLNKYGDKLDIIFMYGHNHSNTYDDCLGGSINYIAKGENMSYFDFDSSGKKYVNTSPIQFTYLNAGYVGYIRNSNKMVNCNGVSVQSYNTPTLTMFTVNEKNITVEKYNINGVFKNYSINRIN